MTTTAAKIAATSQSMEPVNKKTYTTLSIYNGHISRSDENVMMKTNITV